MRKEAKEQTKEVIKFIDEARLDTPERARDTREYEAMLMDFIRNEFKEL